MFCQIFSPGQVNPKDSLPEGSLQAEPQLGSTAKSGRLNQKEAIIDRQQLVIF